MSYYSHDEAGQIWFLDVGHGERRIPGADAGSFEVVPGKDQEGYSGLARDKNHLYVLGQPLPDVSPDSLRYLGRLYFIAGQAVYHGMAPLDGVDPSTFRLINSHYAHDHRSLFYKGKRIPGADIASLSKVHAAERNPADFHYLKDARRVYYHDKIIEGARPGRFSVIKVWDDQWGVHYGYDGVDYFFEEKRLPVTVVGSDETLPSGGLKLLAVDKGFGWHALFYAGSAFYYHDPFENQLHILCTRSSSAPLQRIAQGLYRDDQHVYFSWVQWEWKRSSRGSSRGLWGWKSGLEVVPGVGPEEFRRVGNHTMKWKSRRIPGEHYVAGGNDYFHPTYAGTPGYRAALQRMEEGGQIEPLPVTEECQAYTKSPNRNSIGNTLKGMIRWVGNGFQHDGEGDSVRGPDR